MAAGISTGTKELKARNEFSSSFLFWWTSKRPSSWQTLDSTSAGVDLKTQIGTEWPQATAIQYLMDTAEDEHILAPTAETSPPDDPATGNAPTGAGVTVGGQLSPIEELSEPSAETDEDRLAPYRRVRDEIEAFVSGLPASLS